MNTHIPKNQELAKIYKEDQADRKKRLWEKDEKLMQARDAARLERTLEMIKANLLKAAEDFYHAAMVLQHSGQLPLYRMAARLARKAANRGYKRENALWLFAAATDRALMTEGKLQKYGTQVKKDSVDGEWYVYQVDPAVTDEERKKFYVRPLKESYARAAELNEEERRRRRGK